MTYVCVLHMMCVCMHAACNVCMYDAYDVCMYDAYDVCMYVCCIIISIRKGYEKDMDIGYLVLRKYRCCYLVLSKYRYWLLSTRWLLSTGTK